MDILFAGTPRLERWEQRAFHATARTARDRDDVYERDLAPEAPGAPGERFRRVHAAIRAYSIFPPSLVAGVTRRPIELGDVVGIHYRGFPLVRLFFAARVIEVFDGERDGWWRAGFRYRTLVGHPELGEETFAVEKELATGRVRVALRSWSRPGTCLARAFSPLVRRAQVRASQAALTHLARIATGNS
ncbi:MAG TPA: DUF1990 family protein [Kofleriaceae bacterium]|nr:DUF1990 family protein [Kofleriaceae bacterium]